jgi:nucleotide-binding universal stress UspA family protein
MGIFARSVVGVDGTNWGFEALRQTLVLAPADAAVHAVTALDTRPAIHTGFDAAHWVDVLAREAEESRDEAAALLGDRAGGSAEVVRGDPVSALRRVRDDDGATLLALGGRHSSRFLGILLGDTVTQLLHDATCSVLVARPRGDDDAWSPRAIVAGSDGSAHASAAVAVAEEVADRLGGDAGVVRDAARPVETLVERSESADLIVVGSRGVRGLRALGSVSESVAHRARCSVLVVQAAA